MKLSDLKNNGHWPTLLAAFLYFDFSFMVWAVLGPLAPQIGETLKLSPEQKGLMVALPILAGAVLRVLIGLLVDRVGAKNAGMIAQLVVIMGLALAWIFGLPNYPATLLMGLVLGFAGASFAVALPQAGRWYPPNIQGVVMGLAGAGNIGVVLNSLLAPRLAEAFGLEKRIWVCPGSGFPGSDFLRSGLQSGTDCFIIRTRKRGSCLRLHAMFRNPPMRSTHSCC
jgi:MFS transporter, NNP family, nitrate/nitrite transporter